MDLGSMMRPFHNLVHCTYFFEQNEQSLWKKCEPIERESPISIFSIFYASVIDGENGWKWASHLTSSYWRSKATSVDNGCTCWWEWQCKTNLFSPVHMNDTAMLTILSTSVSWRNAICSLPPREAIWRPWLKIKVWKKCLSSSGRQLLLT